MELQLLFQQIAVVAAVHLPAAADDEAAGLCITQAVAVIRADGGTQMGDLRRQQRQSRLQHSALQAVATRCLR